MNQVRRTDLPWHIVEKKISDEISWLKKLIASWGSRDSCQHCDEFAYRQIALMIVSGKIKARKLDNYKANFWGESSKLGDTKHKHGKEWHQGMMNMIDTYFTTQGFDVTTEPILNNGRADLGVFYYGKKDLYVEVGTVSIYKMWINLSTMKNCIFLCIPAERTLLEFETF